MAKKPPPFTPKGGKAADMAMPSHLFPPKKGKKAPVVPFGKKAK